MIRPIINPHVPYSSAVTDLVIISVKITPVKIDIIPPMSEINPVYVTLIPDKLED